MARADTPWYRSAAATVAAGIAGLVVVAGLVIAVIRMSAQWDSPESQTFVPPATPLPGLPHHIATTSTTSTPTFTTSVKLSTTDIGLPGETTTTGSSTTGTSTTTSTTAPATTSTTESTTTSRPPSTTTAAPAPSTTHTSRPGPRINVTRTLYPPP